MNLRMSVFVLFSSSLLWCAVGCASRITPEEGQANEQDNPDIEAELDPRPATFTDHVPSYHGDKVPFEMVLIPGDDEAGIKPFYVAKTEVTWAMFEYWMFAGDIDNARERAEAESNGLRPSYLGHGHPQVELHLLSKKEQPAIGMSWRVAQAYCRWLSEQTGRTYRLPTDREWRYLLDQSGGVPEDQAALLDRSFFINNANWDRLRLFTTPSKVAQGEPDKLGLYDLLGNAAEWVQPMGGRRWVRGGHFMMEAKEMTNDWLSEEDQEVWNEGYPQLPYSESWYVDHYYQGIRLVCAIPVDTHQAPSRSRKPLGSD